MYSPYDAVYGHDTTYIQRMTVEEYMQELQEEEADVRGLGPSPQTRTPTPPQENKGDAGNTSPSSTPQLQLKRGARQYEQRRTALSSRNPNVIFSSKYPMYDRLGRELCVAYQIQDMAVQQELRRLELEQGQGERDSRRSGVRLSAELPMSSDGTTVRPGSLIETQPPSPAEGREIVSLSEEASRLVRPSHMDCDDFVDIEVSATSQYPSVLASRTSSRPASLRPSEFSIFRESGAVAGVGCGALGKARSSIPVRTVAEEDKILVHRGADGGPLRATSAPAFPSAVVHNGGDEGEDRRSAWRRRSEKRRRSGSSGGRRSRVRFVSEERNESAVDAAAHAYTKLVSEQQQRQTTRAPGAVAPLPRRLPTPPPVPLSDTDRTRKEDAAPEEATRWTTLPRGSAAVRATKQLFRSTAQSVNASRMTATLTYPQPIPSNVYGLSASAISASMVHDALEQNVVACTAAMPLQYTPGFGVEVSSESRRSTPELHCESVVQLGNEWYRLVHFHVVAEVYEALRVDAPVSAANQSISKQDADTARGDDGHDQTTETHASVAGKNIGVDKNVASSVERRSNEMQGKASAPALAPHTPHREQPPALFATDTTPSPLSVQGGPSASQQGHEKQQQQCFVYRWRSAGLSRGVDEARRAALGLSLCAPQAHVTSFEYEDGGGITLVTLPAGYHAVPVSTLPLSLRSYTTLLRTVLKALSAMIARRTIHGNAAALGDLFLVLPVDDPRRVSESTESPRQDGGGGPMEAKLREPFVVLFHWERWVDFGMYVDRNAGRTLPFDFEDDTTHSLVYYSKDLLTGLQLFLEHPLAAELTSEQYILLQKLVVLAAEPTPVASHLIQLKNLMLTLPTDTAALQKSFEAALVRYIVE